MFDRIPLVNVISPIHYKNKIVRSGQIINKMGSKLYTGNLTLSRGISSKCRIVFIVEY